MTVRPEIACSLHADELPTRLAEMRSIGTDALLSVSPAGDLRFRADRATRERLDAIIADESACCAFLDFDLRQDESELVLSIRAPEGAEPIVAELVSAFAGGAEMAAG
jgi:hypothetical protein